VFSFPFSSADISPAQVKLPGLLVISPARFNPLSETLTSDFTAFSPLLLGMFDAGPQVPFFGEAASLFSPRLMLIQ